LRSHEPAPPRAIALRLDVGRQRSVQTKTPSPRIRTYPRRITIADPVPGIAQPRLADTSAFLTWRQPPSR
jgi:hypothetical protein